MPKDNITIYCTAAARDGKDGFYKVGQKVEFDEKEPAHKLLATGRFSVKKEDAEAAKEKLEAEAKAAKSDSSKDDEITKLKAELAAAKKATK